MPEPPDPLEHLLEAPIPSACSALVSLTDLNSVVPITARQTQPVDGFMAQDGDMPTASAVAPGSVDPG